MKILVIFSFLLSVLPGLTQDPISQLAQAKNQGISLAQSKVELEQKSTIFWLEAWNIQYTSNHVMLLEPGLSANNWDIKASDINGTTIAQGTFNEYLRIQLDEYAISPLVGAAPYTTNSGYNVDFYLVAGTINGTGGYVSSVNGLVTSISNKCELVDVFVALDTALTQSENLKKASHAVALLQGTSATTSQSQPSAQAGGTIQCTSAQAFLDCLDSECPQQDYQDCKQAFRDAYDICVTAADLVYDTCVGSCKGKCTCSVGCAARCTVCQVTYGIEVASCLAMLTGGLAGCDLQQAACESGCYLGSIQSFPNPPGCPQGWSPVF